MQWAKEKVFSMRVYLGVPHAPGEAVGRALDRRTSSTSCAPTLNQPNNYDDDGRDEENVDEPADGCSGMSPADHRITSTTAIVHGIRLSSSPETPKACRVRSRTGFRDPPEG